MGKNQFSRFNNEWDKTQWDGYIPINSYSYKEVNELPDFIQNNGLVDKFNSALVVASGSSDYDFYTVIGYRPDEKNSVVDEHAFVYMYDKTNESWDGGILHHADYDGRTTPLSKESTEILNISGITASILLERAPEQKDGTLEDLEKENILSGVSKNFWISNNEMKK